MDKDGLITRHENQTEAAFNPRVFSYEIFSHILAFILLGQIWGPLWRLEIWQQKSCLRHQQCQIVYGEHSYSPLSPPRAPATTIFQIPSRFIISSVVIILKGGMPSRGQAIIQSEIILVMPWKIQGPGDQVEKRQLLSWLECTLLLGERADQELVPSLGCFSVLFQRIQWELVFSPPLSLLYYFLPFLEE